jgi:FAD/FMN-containing dehydrogenase
MSSIATEIAAVACGGPQRLNDIHSGLNSTPIAEVARPRSTAEVQVVVGVARRRGLPISVAGGRHAMGGQQFASGALHIDGTALTDVIDFDGAEGAIEVGAGTTWPQLLEVLMHLQEGKARPWTIRQKQTGADRMTLGGSLSANIHGRGLAMPPLVSDIEAFTLVDASGEVRRVSRRENTELFALAIGGYGLFGIITSVRLRLAQRRTLRRDVEIIEIDELPAAFVQRNRAGYMLGDWQFAIDAARSDFLRLGVFSCYMPVADRPLPEHQGELRVPDWLRLLDMAHRDKHEGFQTYARHYLDTHGQLYHSDRCQLAVYLDDYHRALPAPACHGTEMITELYVRPQDLPQFMQAAAAALRDTHADVIYGTVRLAKRDTETFLPWAKRDCAGVIFNLHVPRSAAGLERAAASFRALIDVAISFGGSYYLTYHRFATREQVLRCYSQMPDFLERKLAHDPGELFQSEWYRHLKRVCS